MSRRSSITGGFGAGVFEKINANIGSVVTVADNIDSIKQLMDMPGFEDLLIDVRETLDFTDITVVSGEEASWDSDTKVLTVPTVKGDKGDNLTMSSVVDNGDNTFTWGFSDGTVFTTPDLRGAKGDTGVQGPKGEKGDKGEDAVPVTLTSITDNGDYTFDWEFSDGYIYTTPTLRGHRGLQGEKGDSVSLDEVEHIGDGVFTWTFSDGTVFTTPRLKGEQGPQGATGLRGLQGERGIGVHHMKGTSTTDTHGKFGSFGEKDTYTFYGDAAETMVLGWFTVMNGFSSAEDIKALGVMLREHYDTNDSGVVDNSEALGGKTLDELEQERDDLLDLKLDKAGGTIENDLTIQGNLYLNGTETIVNTEVLDVKDNEIVINTGEPGNGVTKGTAGIRVDRGSEPDYLFQFDETSDSFKIGKEGNLQKVATREDTPLDAGVAVWDVSNSRFNTTKDLNIDSLNTTGLVNGRDMLADGTKLDGIEEEATADQTAEEIETLYESNPDTNKYTNPEKQSVDVNTALDTAATTLPSAVNEVHAEVDSIVDGTADIAFDNVDTFITASTLEGAIKEVAGEVGDVDSLVTNTTTVVEAINELHAELNAELYNTDSRLYTLELDSHAHSNESVLDGTTASYTQEEKDKLAGLESSHFKGEFTSLAALLAAFPTAFAGDYANVDEGVGQDVVRYVWDTSDVAWIPQLGTGTQLSAAQIKQEYESNPDTNVFSDAEKIKLNDIEANAKDDQVASEVPVTPTGSLVATDVQTALENLHTTTGTLTEVVEKNTAVTGTNTLVRYDKILGNLDVVQMSYTDGDLTTVRYSGDNNTDSFYRDVLEYSSGNLTSIKHYYDKPDLVTESAETVLVYDVDSNLISTQYTEL